MRTVRSSSARNTFANLCDLTVCAAGAISSSVHAVRAFRKRKSTAIVGSTVTGLSIGNAAFIINLTIRVRSLMVLVLLMFMGNCWFIKKCFAM